MLKQSKIAIFALNSLLLSKKRCFIDGLTFLTGIALERNIGLSPYPELTLFTLPITISKLFICK
jgi:hypothetical protein